MTLITILSGVERRRRWSDERKLAFVEAAIVPGASVAAIARDADISPSSIYRWRRELCGKLWQPTDFAAVAVHADSPEIDHRPSDMLIIEIRSATVRVACGVSANLLAAALRELKRDKLPGISLEANQRPKASGRPGAVHVCDSAGLQIPASRIPRRTRPQKRGQTGKVP